MAFDLTQIQELGSAIYPSAESALLELVARSYEAGATVVDIRVTRRGAGKHAVVLESDVGMSDDHLESLGDVGSPLAGNPGPKRMWDTSNVRQYGNLACFAIGKRIEITTCQKRGGTTSRVTMDPGKLKKLERHHRAVCTSHVSKSGRGRKEPGTRIAITELLPEANLDRAALDRLATQLVQKLMFADPDFTVTLSINNVSRATVRNISWRDVVTETTRCEFPNRDLLRDPRWEKIEGSVSVSGIVLPHASVGIRLLVDGLEANKPEFFDAEVPVTFTSRTSGTLCVDFVSDHKGALNPGNPPTINWKHREMRKLRRDLSGAVLNIHLLWAKQCETTARPLLGKETESGWFRELSIAKKSELLASLTKAEHTAKEHIIDHTLSIIGKLMSPDPMRARGTLHADITSNERIMELYRGKNYFQAVSECIKVYCEKVKEVSGAKYQDGESGLMQSVFGGTEQKCGKIVLSTTVGKASGMNIQKGHLLLSQGLIYGVKNPAVSHTSQTRMAEHGLFTEDDCLA